MLLGHKQRTPARADPPMLPNKSGCSHRAGAPGAVCHHAQCQLPQQDPADAFGMLLFQFACANTLQLIAAYQQLSGNDPRQRRGCEWHPPCRVTWDSFSLFSLNEDCTLRASAMCTKSDKMLQDTACKGVRRKRIMPQEPSQTKRQ